MEKTAQNTYWVILLTAALLAPAFAQDNPGVGQQPAGEENRYETTANRLNLSAEQKEKIKALRQNQKQQMMELRQALKEARMKLKEHLNNPEATRDTIAPLANDIKNILAKMVDQRIESVLAAKNILTPDQFKQLQARQKPRQDERGCRPFWLGNRRAGKEENSQEE